MPRACWPMTRCVFRFPNFCPAFFPPFFLGQFPLLARLILLPHFWQILKIFLLPSRWLLRRGGKCQLNFSRFPEFSTSVFPCLPWSVASRTSLHNPLANTLVTLRILFRRAQAAVVTRQTQLISAWKNV